MLSKKQTFRRITFSLCTISLFFCFAFVYENKDPLSSLLEKISSYTNKFPQEKIHLHLDKPYYVGGEDIWFKAYLTNSITAAPSSISKVLYVELINENNLVKRKLKLPVSNGLAWSNIKLPDTLSEGNYRIRSYTQYMRNFDDQFFFDKTIRIGNGLTSDVFSNTNYKYNNKTIDAVISFQDSSGNSFSNKEVEYNILNNEKVINKGKTITNSKGEITIGVAKPGNGTNTTIVTTFRYNEKNKVTKYFPVKNPEFNLEFLPESGVLIENLSQKIAFKATDENGKGVDISGELIDDSGAVGTTFKSGFAGVGSFTVNLTAGKVYKSRVKFNDGTVKDYKFPMVQKSGHTLAFDNSDAELIKLKLLTSENLLNGEELKIIGLSNGNVCYASKVKVNKQTYLLSIPTNKLPNGIIQFTLFSTANLPIAERLIFNKNQEDMMDVDLDTSMISKDVNGNSKLTVITKKFAKPAVVSFSVSVNNTSDVIPDENNESNIFTSLLLSSDLGQHIEKPNHYFIDNSPSTNSELDDLMITKKWQRFSWKKLLGDSSSLLKYGAEKSLSITGTVERNNKIVKGGKVTLMINGGLKTVLDTTTDEHGKFKFDNLIFTEKAQVTLQARDKNNNKNVTIKIDSIPGQAVNNNKNSADLELNVNNSLMNYIKSSDTYFKEMKRLGLFERSIKLEEVTIKEKRNLAPHSSNLNGPGYADYVLSPDKILNCYDISQCLASRLPGVMRKADGGTSLFLRRDAFGSSTLEQQAILLILDNNIVSLSDIEKMGLNAIESIELLKSISLTSIYGTQAAGGVIIITSKRGAQNSYQYEAEGIVNFTVQGYSPSKFYAYEDENFSDKTVANKLNSIYWNPQMLIDASGIASFQFKNGMKPGINRVIIEGMNYDGSLLRKVYLYEIKK